MRIGLFGGSFDPIHNGHILPVLAAREDLDLDVVHYLPTARPPHKPQGTNAPALARNTMVELALLPYPELVVSDVELDLDQTAYTVDTVERYAAEDPEAELHLLLGVDSFNDLMSWRRFQDLIGAVRLVVLARPGERGLTRRCARRPRQRVASIWSGIARSMSRPARSAVGWPGARTWMPG